MTLELVKVHEEAVRTETVSRNNGHETEAVPEATTPGGMVRTALPPETYRRNFRLGVLNGAFVTVASAFIDPSMVMSWFLAQLQVSNVLIGLVQPIRMGSSFILQIVASGHLQKQPRKLPFYNVLSALRCALLLSLAGVVAFVPVTSPWLVRGFFAILIVYSLSTGLIGLPFLDIVGKIVRPSRRGSFFAQRSFWGNTLVLGGSAVVGYLLSEPLGLTFPVNVAMLFVLAAALFGVTSLIFSFVQEPDSPVSVATVGARAQFRKGLAVLREDKAYRDFALARLALVPPDWVTPFYVVYAKEVLGVAPEMIGVYLAARTVAAVLSNLLWSRLSNRRGNRAVVQGAAMAGIAIPLLALANGVVGRVVPDGSLWPAYGYGFVFVAMGVFSAGSLIAGISYLLDIVPEAERPLYLGFNSTLFGMARFSALASGFLVNWLGFTTLIVIAAGFYALAIVLSLRLVDPRGRVSE